MGNQLIDSKKPLIKAADKFMYDCVNKDTQVHTCEHHDYKSCD